MRSSSSACGRDIASLTDTGSTRCGRTSSRADERRRRFTAEVRRTRRGGCVRGVPEFVRNAESRLRCSAVFAPLREFLCVLLLRPGGGGGVAYITNEDIEARLGASAFVQLTDDDGDGEADAAVVDEIRLAAEGEVNSYLAQRYAAPIDVGAFPELSALLKSVTLDVAEFRCRVRRPPVAEDARRLYDSARGWLAD
ncbi:MAG: DUF1320 domain-containing protein, partial [Phycisphaerae bacterium]